MKRIYMIDCPGIVPPNPTDTDTDLLLRGSVRVENVEFPAQYIDAVLRRVQPRHLQRTYDLKDYENDAIKFLELLCRKSGRLLKGGEADVDGAAKMVLNDWIRGKIPWFSPPPFNEEEAPGVTGIEGRDGRLGEMSKKRKRDTATATASVADTTDTSGAAQDEVVDDDEDDNEEFGGFSDDDGLELDVDEAEDDVSDDDEAGGATLGVDASEDDDDEVEEEVAEIAEALAKAKKRQRTV
jgi:nuclear GTP-binding protein